MATPATTTTAAADGEPPAWKGPSASAAVDSGGIGEATAAGGPGGAGVAAPQTGMMYRRNFGKTGIYVPPGGSNPQGVRPDKTPFEDEEEEDIDDKDEFIQRQDLHDPSDDEKKEDDLAHTSVPAVEALSSFIALTEDRRVISMDESRPFDEAPDGDDDIEPPRIRTRAKPEAASASPAVSPRAHHSQSKVHSTQKDPLRLDRFNLPPPRISSPASTLFAANTRAARDPSGPSSPDSARRAARAPGRPGSAEYREQSEEDDSLFDFRDSPRRQRNRWPSDPPPSPARVQGDVGGRADPSEGDDFERRARPSALSPRSSQLRSHRRMPSSEAEGTGRGRVRESSPNSARSASVSFCRSKDTIQYYEPEVDDDPCDNTTLADRSLNSEYTKSAESEVEDLIKDIFLLGTSPTNPGRRKVKYSSIGKHRLREARQKKRVDRVVDVDDEETYETYEESDFQGDARKSRHSQSSLSGRVETEESNGKQEEEESPITDVWNFMEGGIKSVSHALGLTTNEEENITAERQVSPNRESYRSQPTNHNIESNHDNWLKILGKSGACTAGSLNAVETSNDIVAAHDEEIPHSLSLEDDMRLVDLASEAARSVHKLQGLEFDESYEIDIANDMNFAVVDLRMPFGLIFQENLIGCWITKVLADGSAARTKNVQVGDQLAAIDGISAINMKVDEISDLVRKKNGRIELTFLRYVGPLRPAPRAIEEEGYEVKTALIASQTPFNEALSQGNITRSPPRVSNTAHTSQLMQGKRRFRLFGRGRSRK